jgi:hypothetical protein
MVIAMPVQGVALAIGVFVRLLALASGSVWYV